MKRYLMNILLCTLVMIGVPVIFLGDAPKEQNGTYNPTTEATTQAPLSEENENADTIAVFRTSDKEVVELDLFEYVCGSVAAEMPLIYHPEALKAQAIACYTNALRLKENNTYSENAHISDNPAIHQGYLSEEQRQEKWGDDFEKYESKLHSVVSEVENKALYYKDELCVAAFFAISAGTTEEAEILWGEKIPYLVSVKSKGDSLSPNHLTEVTVNREDFEKALKALGTRLPEDKSLKSIIKITDTSPAGTVLSVKINNKTFTGEEIRQAFSLRSCVFDISADKNSVTFSVKGYGHGVGMSQYGADFAARQGSSYEEILKHYYKGVTIK